MARVKTFVNGGSLLPGDLDAMQDDYEFAFSAYKHILDKSVILQAPGSSGSNPYLLVDSTTSSGVQASGASAGLGAFYLDPAWYTANTRSTYFRIVASLLVNATAPAITFTLGLYPVSSPAGASSSTVSVTLGTVISGSTIPFASPPAGSVNQANSGNFAAPTAGYYALGVITSGAAAANSGVAISARLQLVQI